MQEALEREGTPEPEDLERRVNRMAGTMESIARNLAVVDEAIRGTDRRLENIVSGLDSLINVILPGLADSVKGIAAKGRKTEAVYVPPTVEIPDKLVIGSFDMEHLAAKLPPNWFQEGFPEKVPPRLGKGSGVVPKGVPEGILNKFFLWEYS